MVVAWETKLLNLKKECLVLFCLGFGLVVFLFSFGLVYFFGGGRGLGRGEEKIIQSGKE